MTIRRAFMGRDAFLVYEILIFVFILFSAFFSGAETAIISSRRIAIETSAKKGKKSARRALYILDNMEDAIGMILIGNNIANVTATAFITYIATASYMLNDRGIFAVTAVQTLFFLLCCEIFPKIIARARAESFLNLFSLPIKGLTVVFRPVNRVSLAFTSVLKKILGIRRTGNSLVRSREELNILFKIGEKEGVIDGEHLMYVSEILSFKEMTAHEIMTPTIDIVSIELQSSVRQLVGLIESTRFSRIPVFDKRVDNIVGYIFFRDIFKREKVNNIAEIMIPASYVPSTKNIFELYIEMQDRKIPLVFVVNEYGAVIGMVSHEDIAEEVVGEIQSMDHTDEDLIVQVSEREFLISGDLDIEHFQKLFSLELEKRGFETIAGFVMSRMGKIPVKGEKFVYNKFTFIVEEATDRSVEKIILRSSGKIKLK
ncbi:MAG: hypothetical protein CVV44_19160 [Spirochaetae bacterium HGW-Spirochaetae-1]|jgi:putative hemolysin|nr:MAG: hypothetical protein CVV44_19160 [Spirochaetae bacterium HGW-Spirochaetae-1]